MANMATDYETVNNLVSWAKEHGTILDNVVEIYLDKVTGLSFRAREDIIEYIPIAISSPQTTLSYINAVEALGYRSHDEPTGALDTFPQRFITALESTQCHIIGHFFLVQQYLKGKDSFWYPYIRTLPQPDASAGITPAGWPEEDLRFLKDTNADKAIDSKRKTFKSNYNTGISLLREYSRADRFTWDLYLWAALIFDSRSFQPSLTISLPMLRARVSQSADPNIKSKDKIAMTNVAQNNFSVLHPLLDIGNHNGGNNVSWLVDESNRFCVAPNGKVFSQGEQIYNWYGPKTNGELLVGYGFILDRPETDIAYLQLTFPPSIQNLRRAQSCHRRIHSNASETEWRFEISKHRLFADQSEGRPELFHHVKHGLLDTISCAVANDRERRFFTANPNYCLESNLDRSSFDMSRNIIQVYQVLLGKLQADLQKLRISDANLVAANSNQVLALKYRQSQMETLDAAARPFSAILECLLAYNSICSHEQHSLSVLSNNPTATRLHERIEILSLECAYDWLSHAFPDIYAPFAAKVSELEEEPNPPRWELLAEDFGVVYWAVWVFIVLTLHINNSRILSPFPDLQNWATNIVSSLLEKLDEDGDLGPDCLDTQEQETFTELIDHLTEYPELEERHRNSLGTVSIRRLATYVVDQEMVALPRSDIVKQEEDGEEDETMGKPQNRLHLCIPKKLI